MRFLSIIMIFFPIVINAQDLGNLVYAPLPIDLDKDTTYIFKLNKNYCEKDDYNLFGVKENGSCSYNQNMPYFYITHNFSLGCCTSDFYKIKVENNNIYISVSDTGELCLCGLCTYYVCFYDPNPQKDTYHVHLNCLDTIVSKPTSIVSLKSDNKDAYWEFKDNEIIVNYKGFLKDYIDVKIVNLSGQTIYRQKLDNNVFCINLPNINSLYIMSIDNGINIQTYKILKK
jgi:hypothetical protein